MDKGSVFLYALVIVGIFTVIILAGLAIHSCEVRENQCAERALKECLQQGQQGHQECGVLANKVCRTNGGR